MILYPWAALFVLALPPASIIGRLLASLPIDIRFRAFLSAYLAALAGYLISLNTEVLSIDTDEAHAKNIAIFAPPIFAAILIFSARPLRVRL